MKTIIFDVIDTNDDGLIDRLEIPKSNDGFKRQLFRLDKFSLQSTFSKNKPDESIYVLDHYSHSIALDNQLFDSAQRRIDYTASALEKFYSKQKQALKNTLIITHFGKFCNMSFNITGNVQIILSKFIICHNRRYAPICILTDLSGDGQSAK